MARKPISPYTKELGYVASRKNATTNGWVVLYDGKEAGLQMDSGRWHLYCAEHGSLYAETSKARATKVMKVPTFWCSVCKRKHDEKDRPMKPMILDESDEARDREMRLWAKRAKNNPEKCRLFEQIYGIKPDEFWD